MISLVIAAALLATVPVGTGIARDRCDVYEINCVVDRDDVVYLKQALFLDRKPGNGDEGDTYEIIDARTYESDAQWPVRDYDFGGWVIVWIDGDRPRSVRAQEFRTTCTLTDPEIEGRQILPLAERRKLSR